MIYQRTVAPVWLALIIVHSLLAPAALAQITIQSAVYGSKQTKAPGHAGAVCYQRNPTILTNAVISYCKDNTDGGVCSYTVPWPLPDQDPGLGCYKNFMATYSCAGFANPKTIEFGGVTDEAANQVANFYCGPKSVGTVTYTKMPSSMPFLSNGDEKTAGFTITALDHNGAKYDGSITVGTRVSAATASIQNLDPSKYYLTCEPSPIVSMNSDGSGSLFVSYQVTGYRNVVYINAVGPPVSNANVTFDLTVNGSSCSGAFNYASNRQSPIEANFFLVLNNAAIPLDIGFQQPQNVTPVFLVNPQSTTLNSSYFKSAIVGSKTGFFQYNFRYNNQYSLPAAVSVSCAFGEADPVVFSTDSVTGRLQISGNYTITQAGRDPDSGSMMWNVTTTLTGDSTVFTLLSGQNIGSVKCTPADSQATPYVQNLGNF